MGRHSRLFRWPSLLLLVAVVFVGSCGCCCWGIIDEEVNGNNHEGMRILYMVTTSKEIVNGKNRLWETLVPVLQESIGSLLDYGYRRIDIFLILGYSLLPHQKEELWEKLVVVHHHHRASAGIGLDYWEDATAFFRNDHNNKRIRQLPRSLARQHRYVLKDKIFHYDFFIAMEDDMLVHGQHVQQYLEVTQRIHELQKVHEKQLQHHQQQQHKHNSSRVHWTMDDLRRLRPGFLRVEVLQNTTQTQETVDLVSSTTANIRIDPSVCCGGFDKKSSTGKKNLMVWETSVVAMRLYEFPLLGWVVLLEGQFGEGAPYAFDPKMVYNFTHKPRPHRSNPRFGGQSGGWMMTQREALQASVEFCEGGFVPPYYRPHFPHDGLFGYSSSVEFFSGGLELWQKPSGCNLQRIIVLDQFSHHLLYHTSNNKQRSIPQERRIKAQDLLAQLHTVKEKAMSHREHGEKDD